MTQVTIVIAVSLLPWYAFPHSENEKHCFTIFIHENDRKTWRWSQTSY